MTVPMRQQNHQPANASEGIMEQVLIKGDLAKLTPDERVRYYNEVCKSLGLNPFTKPFDYIVLNGKMQLYALRNCADQMRKINSVSLEVVSRDVSHDLLTIHVRARLPDGRCDEDLGVVPFPETLRGEARANAELKAVTKAKRRATLSICGLGWLDETEVESIPGARRPPTPAPNALIEPAHDAETGEVVEEAPPATEEPRPAAKVPTPDAYVARWEGRIAELVPEGVDEFSRAWAVQEDLRGQIEWNGDALAKLRRKVKQALEAMRT